MTGKVLLSREGARTLAKLFGLGRQPRRAIRGLVLGYQNEGLWFQDARLFRSGEMVLVRWDFVEAVLSDVTPQPSKRKSIGFLP